MIADEPRVEREPGPHRWNRQEYYALSELGLFEGRKVELIEGTIYEHPGDAEPHPIRWDSDQYYRIWESGVLNGTRVELIEGTVYEMAAMNRLHWVSCQLVLERILEVFQTGYTVTSNLPVYLSDYSEPEPDLAVLRGDPRDFLEASPMTPLLILEVSDSSLRSDRTTKASTYASKGVLDYWIVNVNERQLEIRRDPRPDPSQPFGFGYASVTIVKPPDTATPLAKPEASVRVSDLLP